MEIVVAEAIWAAAKRGLGARYVATLYGTILGIIQIIMINPPTAKRDEV